MITDEEIEQLNNLTLEQLARVYIREVDPNETFQNLSEVFTIPLVRNNRIFSNQRRFEQQRQRLRNDMTAAVINARTQRRQQQEQEREQRQRQLERRRQPLIPPEPTQQPPEVNWNRTFPNRPLSELDRLRLRNQELERENTRLRNYIMEHPPAPPEPKQQAPEQRGFANVSDVKLKPIDKKEVNNQFINNYIHERAMKDISDVKLKPIDKKELQEREDERLNDWRVVVNDERKQFKKSHHQMNFDEYKKATENSDKKIAELKAYLNEDRTTWLLEFDKIKPEALEANKQLFIDWWTEKSAL